MVTNRNVTLFLFCCITVVLCSSKITFDNLDIERLLSHEEQTKLVFACLMDRKPCGELQDLKDTIAVIIKTKCNACSPKDKKKYDYVSKVLIEKKPEIFNALVAKYSTKEHH